VSRRLCWALDLVGLSAALALGGAALLPLLPLYVLLALTYGVNSSWMEQLLGALGTLGGVAVFLWASGAASESPAFWSTTVLLALGLPAYLKLSLARWPGRELLRASEPVPDAALLAELRHELRTPLQGVIGACEVIRLGSLDADQRSLNDAIARSAWLQLEQVNNALAIAEAEAEPDRELNRDFDLHQLIGLVTGLASQRWVGKGLHVTPDIAPDIPSRVRGNDVYLTRLLVDLVDAVSGGRPGSEVAVGVSVLDAADPAMVQVGFDIGLRESPLSEVGPMPAADPTLTRLARAIGARLEIGIDARVHLTVPLVVAESIRRMPEPQARLRVLVVGETLLARRIEETAAGWQADIEYETGSAKAFARLLRATEDGHRYSALIVQRHHIAMTPDAFLRSLRREPSLQDLPVVLVESEGRPDERLEWLQAGYSAVLEEPLDETALFGALQAARPLWAGSEPICGTGRESEPLRVLVAEDNATNQMLLRRMLEHGGHQVRMVEDGQAALEALCGDGSEIDLAIVDYNMPRLDGLSAIRRYREHEAGVLPIPVLVLTANASDDLRRECRAEGIADVLAKPIDYQGLVNAIDSAFSDSRFLRQARAAAGEQNGVPVLDPDVIDALAGADPMIRRSLDERVQAFRHQGIRLVARLETAAGEGDPASFAEAARMLRRLASELGARSLAARLSAAEQMAVGVQAGNELVAEAADIAEAHRAAIAAIERHVARHQALVPVR
jgi:two-component system sensor histidine kinase RpfC